jgi:hypothetical protein
MIPIEEVSIDAPRGSDAWYLALMQHPGSFLPFGAEQVIRAAEPYFGLVERSSGRLDYIETIKQWRVPARLHLGRERQQRLLRARVARSLPAGVRQEPRLSRLRSPGSFIGAIESDAWGGGVAG